MPTSSECRQKQQNSKMKWLISPKPGGINSTSFPSSVVSEILIFDDFCIEQKGKTLFLLKQASKPVAQVRKRRKLNIYGEQPVDTEMKDEGDKEG